MYTLEQLQQKSLNELKEIGWRLNVLPAGDRRLRQSWIEAIAGVNPPLLQLLEVSPAASVEQVQEPIIETVETAPGVEVEPVQSAPLESKFGRIVYPRPVQGAISQVAKTSPGVEVDRVTEPISQVAKTSPGVEVEQAQKRIEEGFNIEELWKLDEPDCPACGGIDSLRARWSQEYAHGYWIIYCDKCDSTCSCSIELLPPCLRNDDDDDDDDTDSQNSLGVEVDRFPECVECFGDGYLEDESGLIKSCSCSSSETKLSRQKTQSAIAPASDLNPILTGVALSDRFLARYTPPQAKTVHFQPDADGQLSLIDFEVRSLPEPPDPDDFESLDAFREAIALWDSQNPEPLDVSLDSMCEWAPCPEEWYEPKAENLPLKASSTIEPSEPPEVMELSTGSSSSITCNFSIPTFGAWCDRSNGSDEPPDTGIFARLPKPKPPKFPPQSACTQVEHKLNTSWTRVNQTSRYYPEAIPKLFHRVAAGSSTQPARSPPGGDANFA